VPTFADEDLRTALNARAMGAAPRRGLRERINRATRSTPQRRSLRLPGTWSRPSLARIGAVGIAAALLVVAPLAGSGSADRQAGEAPAGRSASGFRAAPVIYAAEIEDAYEGDDDGDEDADDAGEDLAKGPAIRALSERSPE
jgi:anti-sigma factor RsiW